ncbi:NAD kinase [Bacteroidia bacterium]|nr:NAD kinase [Bacteroidia bacterium]
MRIGIFGKEIEQDFFLYLEKMLCGLKERGVELLCEEAFARFLSSKAERKGVFEGRFDDFFNQDDIADKHINLLLSVGGDGTFLHSVRYAQISDAPVLGLNTGRLGFLANLSVTAIEASLAQIAAGEYATEERELLKVRVTRKEDRKSTDIGANKSANTSVDTGVDKSAGTGTGTGAGTSTDVGVYYVLNEVSVQKTEVSSLLKVHTYIDDTYLTTYWSDGLIVATPTGSTAYSLSGGGPIIAPGCKNILLTPLCAHNLSVRSLVLGNDVAVRLKVDSRSGDYRLTLDSLTMTLSDDCELEIVAGVAGGVVKTVKLPHTDFYTTLREKLGWGEDIRNKR